MSIYHVPIYDLTKLFANKIPRFLLGFTFCFKNLLLLTLFLRYLCRCHVGILNALSNISMSARFCFCWPSHFYMFLLKSYRTISDEEIKCVFPFKLFHVIRSHFGLDVKTQYYNITIFVLHYTFWQLILIIKYVLSTIIFLLKVRSCCLQAWITDED